ncbi:MAG: outer membrane beta-barrel family protein, partial [Muribaculaceae bacterium]|nr:outer membrane beta-barrel family protein [Muribaculaceae bacterium]
VNTAFVDGNVRASYHQGPSQFTLSYNPSWRNYKQVFDNTDESYIGNDFRVDLEVHDRNPFYYHNHFTSLKYDYSPNINTLFSAKFSISPFFNKNRSLANTIDSYLGNYENDNLTRNKELSPSLDLFFKRNFNDKNSLEVQVVGTMSSSDYRRSNKYFFSDGSDSEYIMDVDSRRRSLISEISYTHQFSDKTSLSAGYQNTVSHSTNTYLTTDYKPILTENNNYVYARLGQQVGKVYFSLATGAKLYWIKNDLNKRHFIRNLTTAQLSWNISQKWYLAAAFQYSPSIPSLSALTDYPQQQTPYLISNGNPDLKVSQNFLYQLMPSFQYKKFSASFLMN